MAISNPLVLSPISILSTRGTDDFKRGMRRGFVGSRRDARRDISIAVCVYVSCPRDKRETAQTAAVRVYASLFVCVLRFCRESIIRTL